MAPISSLPIDALGRALEEVQESQTSIINGLNGGDPWKAADLCLPFIEKARKVFEAEASKGNSSFQYYLSQCYYLVSAVMEKVKLEAGPFQEARGIWLRLAAKQSHPRALFELANETYKARGQERWDAMKGAAFAGSIDAYEVLMDNGAVDWTQEGPKNGVGFFKDREEVFYYWFRLCFWLLRFDPLCRYIKLNMKIQNMWLNVILPPPEFYPNPQVEKFTGLLSDARDHASKMRVDFRPGEVWGKYL